MQVSRFNGPSPFEKKYGFSRVVRAGNLIFTSNTSGRDYETGVLAEAAGDQLRDACRNLQGVLSEAGVSLSDAASVRIYFSDFSDKDSIMNAFLEIFGACGPTFTMVCQPFFVKNMKVELELVLCRTEKNQGD